MRTCAGRKHLGRPTPQDLKLTIKDKPQHECVLPSDRLEATHHTNSVSDCCEFCTTYTSQQRSGGD